jgi:hypothetical protein
VPCSWTDHALSDRAPAKPETRARATPNALRDLARLLEVLVRQAPGVDAHGPVLIRDHHEGYMSWEQFERHQRQTAANRKSAGAGAPREGRALLQGLLLCGGCGRRMQVTYGRRGRQVRYCCAGRRKPLQAGAAVCPDLGGLRVEQVVEQLVLTALEPLGVEAMIAATAAHVRANESMRVRWDQQIERARYEVDLARRQYDAVDPANRLVAGSWSGGGRWR